MKNSILLRLEEEYAKCKDHLRHPSELMARPLADEDFVDAAVVGGVSIEGILAGKIHEDAVPADVKHAFHLQYPRLHEGFVGAVQRLSPHSNKLRGLVNGVRGKLFEINYVDYLNHGHLPAGLVARLATSATNTAWDVSITDHSGHVNQVLQLKASATIAAAQHALRLHPNIDVVIPHDVFTHFSDHAQTAGHLLDGNTSLSTLNHTMTSGVGHAEAADLHFHFPFIGIGIALGTTYAHYRTGKLSLDEAIRKGAQRSFLSIAATAAGYLAQAILHKSIVGIPAAFATRFYLGKWLKRNDLRHVLDGHYEVLRDSNGKLLLISQRPLQLA